MRFPFRHHAVLIPTGTYHALDVAKYVVRKCTTDGHPISNLQLQKILYYIQSAFLKKEHRALFDDEIEAWKFGPVVRSVYRAYCGYGSSLIYESEPPDAVFLPEESMLMDRVIDEKRGLSAWELVMQTHAQGTPWERMTHGNANGKVVIPKEMIAFHEK
jgi:uncharacterized phage-associated protein